MSSETLSEDQRARIQANRERALALRLQKQQQSSTAPNESRPSNIPNSIASSPSKSFTTISDRPIPSNASSFTRLKSPSGSSAPSFTSSKPGSSPAKFTGSKSFPSSTSSFGSNNNRSSSSFSHGQAIDSTVNGLKSKYWSKDEAGTDRDSKGSPIKFGMKRPEIKCVLVANYRFEAQCSYHKEAIDIFRSVQGASYNPSTKIWSFPLSSYREFDAKIRQLTTIALNPLPSHITGAFSKYIHGSVSPSSSKQDFDLSLIDGSLLARLFPFQRECINFAISRGGRVLIADDMGLGKTVEALGILSYYRDDWPVLIVCPASLKYTWKQAIADWLQAVKEEQVAVIDKTPDIALMAKKSMLISIVGYDMLKREAHSKDIERSFKMVVLDECHYIKNPDTQRTKACERILKGAKRVILLSGTPALSRPRELFTQIKAIDRNLFRSFPQFGTRYCDPKTVKISKNHTAVDYSGASNMEELEAFLRETIMIRRVKEDVLHQLPAKVRGIVLLDSRLITMDEKEKKKASRITDDRLHSAARHGAMLEFFNVTATAKLRAVTDYVLELLESRKFLLFAHHRVMLDHLQSKIALTPHELIRIDGHTPAAERKQLCDKFQTDETVRIALLSITASGTGLTLTAANLVVFAELFWNPGILAQAEDRAHRVGQTDSVLVQYLVARGTADDFIWPLIQKKLDILNKGGLSKGAFKTSETTHADATNAKGQQQSSITDFMESICDDDLMLAADMLDQDTTGSPSKKPRLAIAAEETPITS